MIDRHRSRLRPPQPRHPGPAPGQWRIAGRRLERQWKPLGRLRPEHRRRDLLRHRRRHRCRRTIRQSPDRLHPVRVDRAVHRSREPPTWSSTAPSRRRRSRARPISARYARGAKVNADYSCADEPGGSGLDTCVGTAADGDPIDTSHPRTTTFTVTATDNAGNTTTVTHTYTVTDVTDPTVTITTPPDGATYDRRPGRQRRLHLRRRARRLRASTPASAPSPTVTPSTPPPSATTTSPSPPPTTPATPPPSPTPTPSSTSPTPPSRSPPPPTAPRSCHRRRSPPTTPALTSPAARASTPASAPSPTVTPSTPPPSATTTSPSPPPTTPATPPR